MEEWKKHKTSTKYFRFTITIFEIHVLRYCKIPKKVKIKDEVVSPNGWNVQIIKYVSQNFYNYNLKLVLIKNKIKSQKIFWNLSFELSRPYIHIKCFWLPPVMGLLGYSIVQNVRAVCANATRFHNFVCLHPWVLW